MTLNGISRQAEGRLLRSVRMEDPWSFMLDLTTGTIVLAGFVSLDRFQNDLQDLQRKFFRSSEYYEVASRITRAGADAAIIVSAAAQRGR